MRVVCAGHVNWDVALRVDRLPCADGEAQIYDRTESGGGSAANVGVALAGLDCDAVVLGSVGDDEFGDRAVERLHDAGVETEVLVVDGETATKYILVDEDGEVALVGSDGVNEALEPGDVSPSVLDGADAVHLTGQRPSTAARIAALAAERDLPVSFDPGRRVTDRDYGAVLEHTDLLFATEREAAVIDAEIPWRVTKHGQHGAAMTCPDGQFEHDGYRVETTLDSTAAGDAFAAGFLAVWLDDGDPERALRVANACGALAANAEGARIELSWGRVESML